MHESFLSIPLLCLMGSVYMRIRHDVKQLEERIAELEALVLNDESKSSH